MAGAALAEQFTRPSLKAATKPKFSVGAVGDNDASYQRRKIIHGGPVIDHPDLYRDLTTTAYRTWSDKLGPQGRITVLALATGDAKDKLLAGDQAPLGVLETVFPVQTVGGELWVMGAALNGPERIGTSTIEQVSQRLRTHERLLQESDSHVESLSPDYRLVRTIPDGEVQAAYDLWHDPFGWEYDELVGLQTELNTPVANPVDQTVFFAGVEQDGHFDAGAMAEALLLEGIDGEPVYGVEETEWYARRGGVIRSAVEASLAQVEEAYAGRIAHFVFAEVNAVNDKAPRVARDIGMTLPDVRYPDGRRVPGVKMRNVGIGNDKMPDEGLVMGGVPVRDFGVFVLGENALRTRFSEAQREKIAERLVTV